MPKTSKQEIGILGEDYVCRYLKKNKYKILSRNFKTKFGEIDIIAGNDEYITFVEVKTRSVNYKYRPVYAVNKQKQLRIIRTAFLYLKKFPTDKFRRFDVVEVFHNNGKVVDMKYIRSAFMQGGDYGAF